MTGYYFLIALRMLRHRSFYAALNIVGLALGLTAVMFAVMFVRDELSYDRWIPGTQDTYRVEVSLNFPSAPPIVTPSSPYALAEAIAQSIPESRATSHYFSRTLTIAINGHQHIEQVTFVDTDFFEMFPVPFLNGPAARPFDNPNSVVITRSAALRIFGTQSAVGRLLTIGGQHTLTVSSVIADFPYNTTLEGDIFVPVESDTNPLPQSERSDWLQFERATFVELSHGAPIQLVEQKIKALIGRNLNPGMLTALHVSATDLVDVKLTRFRDIHRSSRAYSNGQASDVNGTMAAVIVIAFVIMVMASVNYANLSTALGLLRSHEIAIRKILGATRRDIARQFGLEALVHALLAYLIAVSLTYLLRPLYAQIVSHEARLNILSDWPIFVIAFGMAAFASGVGSIYPAVVLARADMLRAAKSPRSNAPWLFKNAIVILQYSAAATLATITIVIFAQINFAGGLDLGYRYRDVLVIDDARPNGLSGAAADTFLKLLSRSPNILAVARSSSVPFEKSFVTANVTAPGNPNTVFFDSISISPEFPEVYKFSLLAGRQLSERRGRDIGNSTDPSGVEPNESVLINRLGAAQFGWKPRDAVGRTIKVGNTAVQVVGVLNDAYFKGVQTPPSPSIYFNNPTLAKHFSAVVTSSIGALADESVASIWHQLSPADLPHLHWLRDDFSLSFTEWKRQADVFAILVVTAVLIAVLGMLGLAALSVSRMKHEVGMRKLLGAQSKDIIMLLLFRFSIPVLIANAIACPIAMRYLIWWFARFSSHISLSPLYFAAVAAATLLICWFTVAWHVVKLAGTPPISILRNE